MSGAAKHSRVIDDAGPSLVRGGAGISFVNSHARTRQSRARARHQKLVSSYATGFGGRSNAFASSWKPSRLWLPSQKGLF
jgi:hypothetical protein